MMLICQPLYLIIFKRQFWTTALKEIIWKPFIISLLPALINTRLPMITICLYLGVYVTNQLLIRLVKPMFEFEQMFKKYSQTISLLCINLLYFHNILTNIDSELSA